MKNTNNATMNNIKENATMKESTTMNNIISTLTLAHIRCSKEASERLVGEATRHGRRESELMKFVEKAISIHKVRPVYVEGAVNVMLSSGRVLPEELLAKVVDFRSEGFVRAMLRIKVASSDIILMMDQTDPTDYKELSDYIRNKTIVPEYFRYASENIEFSDVKKAVEVMTAFAVDYGVAIYLVKHMSLYDINKYRNISDIYKVINWARRESDLAYKRFGLNIEPHKITGIVTQYLLGDNDKVSYVENLLWEINLNPFIMEIQGSTEYYGDGWDHSVIDYRMLVNHPGLVTELSDHEVCALALMGTNVEMVNGLREQGKFYEPAFEVPNDTALYFREYYDDYSPNPEIGSPNGGAVRYEINGHVLLKEKCWSAFDGGFKGEKEPMRWCHNYYVDYDSAINWEEFRKYCCQNRVTILRMVSNGEFYRSFSDLKDRVETLSQLCL